MLRTPSKRALVLVLLSAGLALLGENAQAAAKRKRPPQVQQDPMETENSPPSNPPPPPPDPVEKPGGDNPSTGGTTRPSHPASSGGSGSGSGSSEGGGPEKAGFFMFNVKIGPAFCIAAPSNCAHQGSIVLDLGAALTANRNGYLLLPVQFQFLPGASAIVVPLGFQYDVRLPRRGLYIYPRVSAGYAALLSDIPVPGSSSNLVHSGVLIAEFGIKYVLNGRWNFGGELISLPLFFNSFGAQLYYRFHLSAGVNF